MENDFELLEIFLRRLYPHGIAPNKYSDAFLAGKIIENLFLIATRKDTLDESLYNEISKTATVGALKDKKIISKGPASVNEYKSHVTSNVLYHMAREELKPKIENFLNTYSGESPYEHFLNRYKMKGDKTEQGYMLWSDYVDVKMLNDYFWDIKHKENIF